MFSALCVVASIIRAYFVAVFETARHIINVGGRTTQPQPQPTISNCLAGCTETKRNTEMTLNTDCAGSRRRKLIKTPPESHMQPTVLLVVLLQPQLPAGDWYTGTLVHWYSCGGLLHHAGIHYILYSGSYPLLQQIPVYWGCDYGSHIYVLMAKVISAGTAAQHITKVSGLAAPPTISDPLCSCPNRPARALL